jgi:hypothetical protein
MPPQNSFYNEFVKNPKLSWAAKGMLHYLFSVHCPGDVDIESLVSMSSDGEDSIRQTLEELKSLGYVSEVEGDE